VAPNVHISPLGFLDRGFKRGLSSALESIDGGTIVLVDADGTSGFGTINDEMPINATVYVRDPAFYPMVATKGVLGAAEAYIEGLWDCDNLTGLIRILSRNMRTTDSLDKGLARLSNIVLRGFAWAHRNTLRGSRANIAAHYDLGNELFEHFLDATMTYSSAVFSDADMTLETAQAEKYERICRKLALSSSDKLVEIGTGWGGFAIHAASVYGCRTTTITISQEQFTLASQRIQEAGLADRIEVLLEDYRKLDGQFDKLASIEMIEAVGHENMEEYFRTCANLLVPDGVAVIQAIVNRDQVHESSKRSVDFIKRHIFPGGSLPCVWSMCDAVKNATDFRLTHLEDITPHYARTLEIWRETMFDNLDAIRKLGYSERFLRTWEFYLCYCEGAFHERSVGAVQTVFEKPMARRNSLLGALPQVQAG
jgi:cyclopropane-fatty-acyl-phospholipid synthase